MGKTVDSTLQPVSCRKLTHYILQVVPQVRVSHTLRPKIFVGKSFGGKSLAEKLSDNFLNFGGKTFGQTFLSVKTDRCF